MVLSRAEYGRIGAWEPRVARENVTAELISEQQIYILYSQATLTLGPYKFMCTYITVEPYRSW
jgi:phage baseplate assembly protein W